MRPQGLDDSSQPGSVGPVRLGPDISRLIDSAADGAGATHGNTTAVQDVSIEPDIGGRYRLIEPVGEGGFGTVYRAQQLQPVQREVALKLIKLGMDTRAVIARFEAERQALALMDHPGVAKVFDAGSTRHGRPFFVMEFVSGEPITTYCDRHTLSTRDRLELFIRVCNAVAHAHTKGIIHRDLKPSNVLVATHDGKPAPKVIDFGIAKAAGAPASARTLLTDHRQFIGTPEYMSPEQAKGVGTDVDTRSDVYSLGILLYELLTGAAPFDSHRLRSAGYEEIQRIISEEDPPRPSTRASSARPDSPAHEGGSPRPLKHLRGDLDWIVMKAIEKDRARRYESASALAADVQRHLNDEPVEASPPSVRYRFGKFARRNTVILAAGSVVTLALLVGLSTTTIGFVQARREAARAHKAEIDALSQRDAAQRAEHDAIAARDESEEVIGFLVEMLGAADPGMMGRDVTVRQVLDLASADLGTRFADRPLVEARLQDVMGRTYQSLGFFDQAETHLHNALEAGRAAGASDSQVLLATSRLSVLYHVTGRTAKGRQMIEEALAVAQRSLGPDHDVTLTLLQNFGTMLRAEGKWSSAERTLRDAVTRSSNRFGSESGRALSAKHNLALLLQECGRYEQAMELTLEVVNARRRAYGSSHPQTLVALQNLAALLGQTGRAKEGRNLLEGILRQSSQSLGEDHPRTTSIERTLAIIYLNSGELDRALELMRHAAELDAVKYGPDSPRALQSNLTLAEVFLARGDSEQAQHLIENALSTARKDLGPDHEVTLKCMLKLAGLHQQRDMLADASALLEEALGISAASYGDASPDTLSILKSLAAVAEAQDQPERAAELLLRLARAHRELVGEHDERTIESAIQAARSLVSTGRLSEAESLLLDVHERCAATHGPEHMTTALAMRGLAGMYRSAGDAEKAEQWRERYSLIAASVRGASTQRTRRTADGA